MLLALLCSGERDKREDRVLRQAWHTLQERQDMIMGEMK